MNPPRILHGIQEIATSSLTSALTQAHIDPLAISYLADTKMKREAKAPCALVMNLSYQS